MFADIYYALLVTGALPWAIGFVIVMVLSWVANIVWCIGVTRKLRMLEQWCMNHGLRINTWEDEFSNLKTRSGAMWEDYLARGEAFEKSVTIRARTGRVSTPTGPIEEVERGGGRATVSPVQAGSGETVFRTEGDRN